jgi:hypothetical protein
MSGMLIVDFSRQSDMDDLKMRFKKLAPDGGNLIPPHIEGEPPESRKSGLRIEIPDKIWGKKVVTFEYAIWDQWSAEFAFFFGLEIIKRYKIKRIGWDCIGWCKTTDDYKKTRNFELRRFATRYMSPDNRKIEFSFLNRVCRTFKRAAKRFFDGDGSDLILKEQTNAMVNT